MASLTEHNRQALKTIFSLDYHVAVLRAQIGEVGFKGWLARKPPSYPSQGALDAVPFGNALIVRLQHLPPDSVFSRHAAGSCASAMVAAARGADSSRQESWLRLGVATRLFSEEEIRSRLGQDFRQLTPAQAYAMMASPGCSPRNVVEEVNYDDFQVTTAKVSLEVDLPIDEFTERFDPRRWDVRAPEIFARADEVNSAPRDVNQVRPKQASDVAAETPRARGGTAGRTLNRGLLFENAIHAAGSEVLLNFQNVLNVDYQAFPLSATAPKIVLTYSLNQALSLTIEGGRTLEAGLDVDSGIATVEPIGLTSTRHTASKSLRFAAPANRRDVFNWNSFVALGFWLKNLVVQGVCLP
jgi:hypothetical protein